MQSKPKVVISKCLTFDACRWNGDIISNNIIEQLKDFIEFIPVCPEVEIGMQIPREPSRMIERYGKLSLKSSTSGDDYTEKITNFSKNYVNKLEDIDGFILKSRSPSCGLTHVKVYPKHGKSQPKHSKGVGFFAFEALKNHSFLHVFEDEGRILNLRIREHFFTKLYTFFRFNKLKKKLGKLVEFHGQNKYLFMAYNQKQTKVAGKIVANHEKLSIDEIFNQYAMVLNEIFIKMPTIGNHINVLQHIFGYFSNYLTPEEKQLFIDLLEQYKQKQVPLIAAISVLNAWATGYKQIFLLNQFYLQPFPKELQSIFDTAKKK